MFSNVKYCYFSWVTELRRSGIPQQLKKVESGQYISLNISPRPYSEIKSLDTAGGGLWTVKVSSDPALMEDTMLESDKMKGFWRGGR